MTTSVNVMDLLPNTEWASVEAGSSVFNAAPAINAFLSNPSFPRKKLTFPPGQIALGDRLYPTNETEITGQRTNLFMLSAAQGGNPTAAAFWLQGIYGWSISGFRIDGNVSHRAAVGVGDPLVAILHSGEGVMRDMKVVLGPSDGISIGYDNPLDPASFSTELIFDNVHCEANGRNGFSLDGVQKARFQNCRSRGNVGAGPRSGYALEPSKAILPNKYISFVGCDGSGNTGHGLYADSSIGANIGVKVIITDGFNSNGQGNIDALGGATITQIA